MGTNRLRQRLADGDSTIGTFVFLNDPAVVEIVAMSGFQFVVIDMEHAALGLDVVENMARAAEARGVTALVRVQENDQTTILRVLETGVQGIVVSFIEAAADVHRARAAMLYPPEGERGYASISRSSRYGAVDDPAAHVAESNRELLLVGIVESPLGVENIDEILDAGLDVTIIGRGDLATALRVPGQIGHPQVVSAVDRVLAAIARRHGQWSGIVAYTADEGRQWIERGVPMVAFLTDTAALRTSYRSAAEIMLAGNHREEA